MNKPTDARVDPSDGKIHIRKDPDAPTIAAAYCGKRGQATVTSADGACGPDGAWWKDMCRTCVKEWRNRHKPGRAVLAAATESTP